MSDPQVDEIERLRERYARMAKEGADADVLRILSAAIFERAAYLIGFVVPRLDGPE